MDLLQSGLASQDLSHHVGVGGVVGGEVDGTAGLQDVHEGLDELLTHEPALVVPGFRPRVRKNTSTSLRQAAGSRRVIRSRASPCSTRRLARSRCAMSRKCPRDAFAVDVVWRCESRSGFSCANCRAVSPSRPDLQDLRRAPAVDDVEIQRIGNSARSHWGASVFSARRWLSDSLPRQA